MYINDLQRPIFQQEIYLYLCLACLDCNKRYLIRKTGFKWIIKNYWYVNCFANLLICFDVEKTMQKYLAKILNSFEQIQLFLFKEEDQKN